MGNSQRQLPVFVYGTLRHGQSNYHLLAGRTVAERPATLDHATLHALPNFPMLTEGAAVVQGELMTLDPHQYDAIMVDLDRLEDYVPGLPDEQNLYLRRERTVTLEDQSQILAWVYFGTPALLAQVNHRSKIIDHGDWCRYLEDKREVKR